MKAFTAGLVAGAIALGVAGAASAAKSDLVGVWLPAQRSFLTPAAKQSAVGAPTARERPPYNPQWETQYEQLLAQSRAGKTPVDPSARCLPPGIPRLMNTPFPFEISLEKSRVLFLFEIGPVRRLWTDGRKHPEGDDLDPTFNGDSVAHWEGDTLVVDTVGLRADAVFDQSGAPHSDKLHVVERIRLASKNQMEDRIVVEDPVAFVKPWEITYTYDRKPTWKIMEFVCEENNRGINGQPINDDNPH